MRRLMALPVAAVVLALLAGCGAGGDETASADQRTEPEPQQYARSVQAWSPYMELWAVDGTSVTYAEINCLGQEGEVTAGVWEGDTITWEGRSPIQGAGMGDTSLMEPLTEDTLHRVGARESAVSDLEGQKEAHIERCREAGETVGRIVLG